MFNSWSDSFKVFLILVYEAGHEKRYQVLEMDLSTQRYRRDINESEEKKRSWNIPIFGEVMEENVNFIAPFSYLYFFIFPDS